MGDCACSAVANEADRVRAARSQQSWLQRGLAEIPAANVAIRTRLFTTDHFFWISHSPVAQDAHQERVSSGRTGRQHVSRVQSGGVAARRADGRDNERHDERRDGSGFRGIRARSSRLQQLRSRPAPSEATILPSWASLAREGARSRGVFMERSGRRGPFVAVNCGALTESLAEGGASSGTKVGPSPALLPRASDGSRRRRAARCCSMKCPSCRRNYR